jgi:uncharacterized protein (DUF1684 family)
MTNLEVSRKEWESWKEQRAQAVISPTGNLALFETHWLADGEEFKESEVLADRPKTIVLTKINRKDFDGNVIQRGYRLWDSKSESIKAFSHIETFDFSQNEIYDGTFSEFSSIQPIAFEYIRDNGGTRDLAVPGEIAVDIKGATYHLNAFDDDGVLLLVFADPTNGKTTYGSGRFLFVDRIPNSSHVVIDFNRAFVPPCGFSNQYNCPLPPQQNRISTAIEAGERNPIFTNGYELH